MSTYNLSSLDSDDHSNNSTLIIEINDAITWLDSVAHILPESRVNDEGTVFTKYEGGFGNWFWRKFVTGESRMTQTMTMERKYDRIQALIKRCTNLGIPIEYLRKLHENLQLSTQGLRNFCESAHYRNDSRVTSRINTLINPVIQLLSKDLRQIVQRQELSSTDVPQRTSSCAIPIPSKTRATFSSSRSSPGPGENKSELDFQTVSHTL